MDLTPLQLLEELDIANSSNRDLDGNSREVFKKQKSKKENYSSRLCEELKCYDSVTSLGLKALNPQTAFSNNNATATTCSREIAGITAQHVKTERGIKVSLTIQTYQDQPTGEFVSLTAELKRHGRLRELKRYSGDSTVFEQHYIDTINSLKELTPEEGRYVCCGRIHERGKRAKWFADMMVVGNLNDSNHLDNIILWYGSEEYEIAMTNELTVKQAEGYHTSGIYGEVKTQATAPTLATAKRRTF